MTDDEVTWDTVRARFDEIGMKAIEGVKGVDSETAGKRIAELNDMIIEKLKEEGWTP